MFNHTRTLIDNIHWLSAQSIYITIESQEIHRETLPSIKKLLKNKNINLWEMQQILRNLSLAILKTENLSGFVDIIQLKQALPHDFFHLKENEQVRSIQKTLGITPEQQANLSRFMPQRSYSIFWTPDPAVQNVEEKVNVL